MKGTPADHGWRLCLEFAVRACEGTGVPSTACRGTLRRQATVEGGLAETDED
jgi:hypothetical protein